jgi:multidrug efflux pump
MPKFFIDRPVFAWVIPILICLIGVISMLNLGIDSYPDIAPPEVTVTATYPGASAATMESTVTQVIEQQLTGIDNLLYFNSASNSNGTVTITLSFATGTNPDTAEVQVQNKVALAQPLLPAAVTQQGVVVAKASPDILLFISLQSSNPAIDAYRLSDIVASQIQPVIARVNGVGNTFELGSEYAVRIWLNPDKLQGYGLSTTQVLNAVSAQNAQFATGSLGADPAVKGQVFTATVSGDSLFSSIKQFNNIILLTNNNGTVVRLSDVARITFGAQSYGSAAVYKGKAAGGMGVYLLPGANALAVAKAVKAEMGVLAKDLPPGVTWNVPYDTTPFITASITDVVRTLIEAIALVFVVMLIFLQNLRATIIPTLVIPVALLGTFIGLSLLHYTLNQLTLFGMVLAIGIVVDDAIVVIENVERIMTEENLQPREATRKAMGQITGAIIAITVVLSAVFIPSALQPGATGIIYAQFALTIAVSMAMSAFLAMSFTPALCAAILKPTDHHKKNVVFRWFDKGFDRVNATYFRQIGGAVRHAPRWMIVFLLLVLLTGFLYTRLPTSFVPDEDQGFILALVNLPTGATLQRTDAAMTAMSQKLEHSAIAKDIDSVFQVEGFSFVGSSENVGMAFIKLTDWGQRSQTAMQLIPQVNRLLHGQQDAQIFAVNPRLEPVRRCRHVSAGACGPVACGTGEGGRHPARECCQKSDAVRHSSQFAARSAAVAGVCRSCAGAGHGAVAHGCLQLHPDGARAVLCESVHLWRPGQARVSAGRCPVPDGRGRVPAHLHAEWHHQRIDGRDQYSHEHDQHEWLSDQRQPLGNRYLAQPVQHGPVVQCGEVALGCGSGRAAAL